LLRRLKALDKDINVDDLERLAQKTWEDSLDWSTLSQLVNAQYKSIIAAKAYIERLAKPLEAPIDKEVDRFQKVLTELVEIEKIISGDFVRRGQSISNLVCSSVTSSLLPRI
jgi:hypothetical protein